MAKKTKAANTNKPVEAKAPESIAPEILSPAPEAIVPAAIQEVAPVVESASTDDKPAAENSETPESSVDAGSSAEVEEGEKVHESAQAGAPVVETPAVANKIEVIHGMIAVKYIGKRESYTEGMYGTGIQFKKGETKNVPEVEARKMLRHTDQYEPGEAKDIGGKDTFKVKDAKADTEEDIQLTHDLIATLDGKALAEYAKTHFGQMIDQRKNAAELRIEVSRMVDQFGLN